MAKRNETGKDGESVARAFLEKQGYKITHTNWHWHHYELDIVAVKDTWLVVVEVKTRSDDYLLAPEDAVDAPKIRRIVAKERKLPFSLLQRDESERRIPLGIRLYLTAIQACPRGKFFQKRSHQIPSHTTDKARLRPRAFRIDRDIERRAASVHFKRRHAVLFLADHIRQNFTDRYYHDSFYSPESLSRLSARRGVLCEAQNDSHMLRAFLFSSLL